jgi:hypothetical protein
MIAYIKDGKALTDKLVELMTTMRKPNEPIKDTNESNDNIDADTSVSESE